MACMFKEAVNVRFGNVFDSDSSLDDPANKFSSVTNRNLYLRENMNVLNTFRTSKVVSFRSAFEGIGYTGPD